MTAPYHIVVDDNGIGDDIRTTLDLHICVLAIFFYYYYFEIYNDNNNYFYIFQLTAHLHITEIIWKLK